MNIAIITGGKSGEREVSINSAANIAEIIDFGNVSTFYFPEDAAKFSIEGKAFDITIPMIHGTGGEDGELQEYLENLNMPYLFSTPRAHQLGIDKRKSKEIANKLNIRIADEIKASNPLFPLFAKPIDSGSSLASKLCKNAEDLETLLATYPEWNFILEEPIIGREFTVGVVEKDNKHLALPVIEIVSKDGFFDYESKYDSAKLAEEICPANINEDLENYLKDFALAVHEEINARHISRSDFIVDENNEIYFLEINTIPGLTKTSLIPKMLKAQGLNMAHLLKEWIRTSID